MFLNTPIGTPGSSVAPVRPRPARWVLRALAALMAVLVAALPGRALAQDAEPVKVSVRSSSDAITPGEQFQIAVIFELAPNWHIYTNNPVIPRSWKGFTAIPTDITVEPVPGLTFGPIQWPRSHEVRLDLALTGKPEPIQVFEGRAIAYLPVIADPKLPPGSLNVQVTVTYQACDDKTCLPEVSPTLPVPLRVKPAGSAREVIKSANAVYFDGFDRSVFNRASEFAAVPPAPPRPVELTAEQIAEIKRREAQKVNFDAFGLGFRVDAGTRVGLVLLVLTAILGGFILNLTPCVLPVIPLKIMGLSQSAENPRRCLLLGTFMSLGVVAFWLAIGALIAFSTSIKATSQLSAIPWFGIGVGLFMAFMGAGMLGAFSVSLPQWVYRINPKHDTIFGSFLFGIMTAVLSTPCTAPFAGAATAWGASQPPGLTLVVFAAIGIGMAMPYLILSARPSLVEKMPRSGPGGELVKQVLGLLMFAVAAFFLGTGAISLVAEKPYMGRVLHWWAIAGFVVLTGTWLIVRAFQVSERVFPRILATILGLALAVGPVWWAVSTTREARLATLWGEFSPARFDEARATGKVVVLDFTAEWCLNCKVLEATVLNRPRVQSALTGDDIIALRVDLTARHAPGWPKLSELGEVAIPLLAIFAPGEENPWKSNGYTIGQVVDQIDLAKAKAAKVAKDKSGAGPPSGSLAGESSPDGGR